MNHKLIVVTLTLGSSFMAMGCGRDALLERIVEPPPLVCAVEGFPAGFSPGSAPQGISTSPKVQNCSFEPAKGETAASNIEALVRLVLGKDDPSLEKEIKSLGLAAENVANRADIIKRLLTESAARSLSDDWMSQWLDLPLAVPFPDRFSTQLWSDLREQTLRHGRAVFLEGSRPLQSLLTSSASFGNGMVARYYGVNPPAPDVFGPLQLPGSRVGVLSHAAVLGSHPSVSSRGNLLIRSLLQCQPAPAGPPGITVHDEQAITLKSRKQLGVQLANPVCLSCHSLLEVGFLLQSFDEIGRQRNVDSDGLPLNTGVVFSTFDGNQAKADQLSSFAAVVDAQRGWKTCLAQSLVELAVARTGRQFSADVTDPCSAAAVLGRQLEVNPSLSETMRVLADIVIGAQFTNGGVNDVPVTPLPESPSLGINGKLSACTAVGPNAETCQAVCKQKKGSCNGETCRLNGTLGQAFFFTDHDQCATDAFTFAVSLECSSLLSSEACNTEAPLRWVRCCCD
jgi:hypothetical protein